MIKIQSTVKPDYQFDSHERTLAIHQNVSALKLEWETMRFGKSIAEIKRLCDEQRIRESLKRSAVAQFKTQFNKQTK